MLTIKNVFVFLAIYSLATIQVEAKNRTESNTKEKNTEKAGSPTEYTISDKAHDMKFVAIANHQAKDKSWVVCPNLPIKFVMSGQWKNSRGEWDSSKMPVKELTFSTKGNKQIRSADINKKDAETKLGDIKGGKIRWTLAPPKKTGEAMDWFDKSADVTIHYYITRNLPKSARLKRNFGGTLTLAAQNDCPEVKVEKENKKEKKEKK